MTQLSLADYHDCADYEDMMSKDVFVVVWTQVQNFQTFEGILPRYAETVKCSVSENDKKYGPTMTISTMIVPLEKEKSS